MKITWLGQAGYLIDVNGITICIDPYLSDVVKDIENMPRMVEPPIQPENLRCDFFISTHDHLDHLDPITIIKMDKKNTIFIGPSSCIAHFKKLGIREEQLKSFDRGAEIRINDLILQSVFADHTADSIGIVLRYQGYCLYFVGDTMYHEQLGNEIGNVDVLFTCINGKMGNMNIEEAAALAEKLQPLLVIPNHYGMFAANSENPERFLKHMQHYGIRVLIHKLGEEISF